MAKDKYLVLINRDHPLKDNYVPDNLIELDNKELLEEETYKAFIKMKEDATLNNFDLFVDSGYRSYDHQKDLLKRITEENGKEYADSICAPPGCSEHQSGLCLDIGLKRNGKVIEKSNDLDPEIFWLINHSYQYGFILRYPKGYEDITGYRYEYWHYRYIGIKDATKMFNENIKTYEEYYNKYIK